jgi:hypothetical protein
MPVNPQAPSAEQEARAEAAAAALLAELADSVPAAQKQSRADQHAASSPPQSSPASPAPAVADSSDEEPQSQHAQSSRPRPKLPSDRKAAGTSRAAASKCGGSGPGEVPMEVPKPPLELRAPPVVAGSSKRGKDRIGGTTNSGEVPFKEASSYKMDTHVCSHQKSEVKAARFGEFIFKAVPDVPLCTDVDVHHSLSR